MSRAGALNRAHAALQGIESKNGFLGEETLIRLVQADSFLSRQRIYSNESARVFRDAYREYARQMEKFSRKNLVSTKGLELSAEWIHSTIRYLGYGSFVEASLPHWSEEGTVSYLKSPDGANSVGVFFYSGAVHLGSLEEAKVPLTNPSGSETFRSSRKEGLAEQVERAMRLSELPEAILVTPEFICYFRADSKITGSCLEVRWAEVFNSDNDTSAVLATSLMHADFFAYGEAAPIESTDSSSEEDESKDDEESEGEAEGSSGGSTVSKATPSQELFKEDLEQARKITEDLHKQVMLALEILVNERIEKDPELKKRATSVKSNETIANAVFKDGLFVLYRILFVLYAEARRFLPVENSRYASFYSVEHLRDWSEQHLKSIRYGDSDGSGTYIWDSLKTIFTLLRRGVKLPGGELVSAYNGQLFSPDQAPLFDAGPSLTDAAMARVLTTLSRIGGDESSRRLHFGNLGIEQLGAVYEALLAQKPVIVREPSCWVVAHPQGVGLVSRDFAKKMGHTVIEVDAAIGLKAGQREKKQKGKKAVDLAQFISPDRPAYDLIIGRFVVAPLGGQRRQTASHYTPPKLAEFLVKRTLKPLVEGKSSKEILGLKIVEPAVGSGGFLIACLRYMAPHLLEAKKRERKIELSGREASFQDLQECKREILERCLFGVDINPLSLELCRTSLYLEALVPGSPLPFLHHRLKSGNALVYADLLGQAKCTYKDGVVHNNADPSGDDTYWAVFDIPIDQLKVEKNVWDAWDMSQEAHGKTANSDDLAEDLSNRIKELKAEKKSVKEHDWVNWANSSSAKVTNLLKFSKKAIGEFEAIQRSNEVVDSLDTRHRDRLSLIPDMDTVLIEVQGIEVDPRLERQRKEALIREHGIKSYNLMVKHQRAFMRLKTLSDLHCSLWFWPVDKFSQYPSFSEFRELADWLLDENSLERGSRVPELSSSAYALLRNICDIAKTEHFFQWHVEFAQVFGEQTPGFDVAISNPPWKVVGTKDKEVYPSFDPYFLKTSASQKAARIKLIHKEDLSASKKWLRENFVTKKISARWQSGVQSEMPTEGKNDLSSLFVLNGERLVRRGGSSGRIGLLVSRSAVFVNGGTRSLRERFFEEWGLEEAVSFINILGIFAIDGRVEFTCLVGQPGKKFKPRFVHGVEDPNQLDSVSVGLEARDITSVKGQHRPLELDIQIIGKCFARETLSIPGLTDSRQMDIAAALHMASGPVVYLDHLKTSFVGQGVNQKTGPQKGISEYAENIRPQDLPKFTEILDGKRKKWIPLYRGRQFNINDPMYNEVGVFAQYANADKLTEKGLLLDRNTVVWRRVSQSGNQRTLISCKLPAGVAFDDNVCGVQFSEVSPDAEDTLSLVLGAISTDFLSRIGSNGALNVSIISGLPIPQYKSKFLQEAKKILRSKGAAANHVLDALMWLHYGQNKGALGRENLQWMLESQFNCLKRNAPEYQVNVLDAFDHYSSISEMYGVTEFPIFELIKPSVVILPVTAIDDILPAKVSGKKRAAK